MNSWVYYGLMIVLIIINFMVGGSLLTVPLIIAAAAIAQLDARLDAQNQVDTLVKTVEEKLEKEGYL